MEAERLQRAVRNQTDPSPRVHLLRPSCCLKTDEFSSRSASPLFCSYQRCFQFHPFSFLLRIIHSPRFIILASILGIFTLFSLAVIIRAKLRHVRPRWKATANGINVAALRSPASNGDASAYAPLRAPSLFGSLQHAPWSFRLLLSLSPAHGSSSLYRLFHVPRPSRRSCSEY